MVVIVFEVVEEYWHGGLVQLEFIIAVSANNTMELAIYVIVVSTFVFRGCERIKTKLTRGSLLLELKKIGNWKHGLICMKKTPCVALSCICIKRNQVLTHTVGTHKLLLLANTWRKDGRVDI